MKDGADLMVIFTYQAPPTSTTRAAQFLHSHNTVYVRPSTASCPNTSISARPRTV